MNRMLKDKTSKAFVEKKTSNSKLANKKRGNNANNKKDNMKDKKKTKLPNNEDSGNEASAAPVANKLESENNSQLDAVTLPLPDMDPSKMQNFLKFYQNRLEGQKMDYEKALERIARLKFDDPEEARPLDFDIPELDFDINNAIGDSIEIQDIASKPTSLRVPRKGPLTYNDCLVLNVLHTKVLAHSNGFSANHLTSWYEQTFGKALPCYWLDLLKYSPKFFMKHLPNETVIFAKGDNGQFNDQGRSNQAAEHRFF